MLLFLGIVALRNSCHEIELINVVTQVSLGRSLGNAYLLRYLYQFGGLEHCGKRVVETLLLWVHGASAVADDDIIVW